MKLSIRNQLLLAFAATLLLTLAVSWVGISQTSVLNDRAALMYDQNQLSTDHIADLGRLTMQDRASELEHVLSTNAADKAGYQGEINSVDQEVNDALAALKSADSGQLLSADISSFEQAWIAYKQARDTLS